MSGAVAGSREAGAFLLDAYAARSCPLKTSYAFAPSLVAPGVAPPDPPFFRDAAAIEADIVVRLRAADATLVDLRSAAGQSSSEARAACLRAMSDGVDIIVGGLLPADAEHHRAGRPSLLIRCPATGRGYRPVQIKFHRTLESAPPDEPPLTASALGAPRSLLEIPGRAFRWRTRLNAALQVAHYRRLLEACGFASPEPWAGLIGIDLVDTTPAAERHTVEPVICWLDLARPQVPPDPRSVAVPADAGPISTLDRYDHEHARRVRLAHAALAGEPAPLPILGPECRGCVWRAHCRARLDADDLSLRLTKSPFDVTEVAALRDLGVRTVADLALADLDRLRAAYLPRASHRDDAESRLLRAHRRAGMLHAGVELERTDDAPLDLPRHALEIDVDIETSADDRVYLWGFWVDDPDAGTPVYRAFSAFRELDAAGEAALAASALGWLRETTRGRDAAVYHYSDYETIRIERLASRLPADLAAWVAEAVPARFVDLFALVRDHYLGANGLGLKVVSAVTGFAWRDEEPGGLNSQLWFAAAVGDPDPDVRESARVRVLEYNEDDVRATWHLRRWLREQEDARA